MKKFILPVLLSCSAICLAQSKPNTIEDVSKMAVYPGCNVNQTNEELSNCFKKNLYNDIADELKDFADKVNTNVKSNFVSVSNFVVSTNGMIENVKIKGDDQLNAAVEDAIARLNTKFKEGNMRIAPAKNKKGESVDLAYNLPVRFTIQ